MTSTRKWFPWSERHPALAAFAAGSVTGWVATFTYLICGGDYFLSVPAAAFILLYPGFVVGDLVYKLAGESVAVYSGIFAVGVFYGLVALLIRAIVKYAKRPPKTA
jgi:hypothetical protein